MSALLHEWIFPSVFHVFFPVFVMVIFDTIRVLVIANQICSTVRVKTIERPL